MAYRYLTCKIHGKTKLVHRDVMEQHIGRKLRRNEHVHHRNGDRYDNRIENLEILSAKDHAHHHKQRYAEIKRCRVCRTQFKPKPTKRKRAKTCSVTCANILRSRTEKRTKRRAAAIIRAQFSARAMEKAA
jgi:HNH endonuclease